jgi:hypothetical protein
MPPTIKKHHLFHPAVRPIIHPEQAKPTQLHIHSSIYRVHPDHTNSTPNQHPRGLHNDSSTRNQPRLGRRRSSNIPSKLGFQHHHLRKAAQFVSVGLVGGLTHPTNRTHQFPSHPNQTQVSASEITRSIHTILHFENPLPARLIATINSKRRSSREAEGTGAELGHLLLFVIGMTKSAVEVSLVARKANR